MVIQRWQTVMLLIAAVLVAVFCLTPMGSVGEESVYACSFPVFLILNIVIAVLLLIDIFLFRNLRLQMRVAAVALILEAVSAGLAFAIVYTTEGFAMSLAGAPLIVAALILTWFGRRFMDKDRRLLAAADRLR